MMKEKDVCSIHELEDRARCEEDQKPLSWLLIRGATSTLFTTGGRRRAAGKKGRRMESLTNDPRGRFE